MIWTDFILSNVSGLRCVMRLTVGVTSSVQMQCCGNVYGQAQTVSHHGKSNDVQFTEKSDCGRPVLYKQMRIFGLPSAIAAFFIAHVNLLMSFSEWALPVLFVISRHFRSRF